MISMVLIGVVVAFAILFAAMAFAPLFMEGGEEREPRPASPVSFERRMPRAA